MLLMLAALLFAQDRGRVVFESRCAKCHGSDGNGGELGPRILYRLNTRDDAQLATLVLEGLPSRGMPPNPVPDAEMGALVKFLRGIQRYGEPPVRRKVALVDGKILEGELRGEGWEDLQLFGDDKRVHLLRRSGEKYR